MKFAGLREHGAIVGAGLAENSANWPIPAAPPGGALRSSRRREEAIAALLDTEDADVLFIAGCEENQARFHSRFDLIILLSAPAQVMTGRLVARTGNPYGKAPGDMDRILADLAEVEPLLRRAADHEIRTTIPLAHVVATVLHLTAASPGGRHTPGPRPD